MSPPRDPLSGTKGDGKRLVLCGQQYGSTLKGVWVGHEVYCMPTDFVVRYSEPACHCMTPLHRGCVT